jgi:hypothetical protein
LFGSGFGIHAGIKGLVVNGTGPAGELVFQTRSTSGNVNERMRIDYLGNVGIGTNSPTAYLSVNVTGASNGINVGDFNNGNGTGSWPQIQALGSRGDGNPTFQGRFGAAFRRFDGTAIISGTTLGTYAFGGQYGTATTYTSANLLYAASINGEAEGSFTASTAMATALVFKTGSTGNALGTVNLQYGTERMRIDASGNLLVGKTAVNGTSNGVEINQSGGTNTFQLGIGTVATTNSTSPLVLYSTGAAAYRFYVGAGGTISATSTTISAISDIRYKENVRDLDAGLDKIMALKPRLYDWKEGKGANIKNARGFIAQEFEQVFPDLIDEWRDPAPEGEEPYKSVRQDLIPVLVKAIQEQQALIESLTTRLTALEQK